MKALLKILVNSTPRPVAISSFPKLLLHILLLLLVAILLSGKPNKASTAFADSDPNPWDVSWLPSDQNQVINAINSIVTDSSLGSSANSGLAGYGERIRYWALTSISGNPAGVNPAFALAMFLKEANFAKPGSIAYNQNNPGNLRRGYGAVDIQNGFAVYATMDKGIKAYYWLLQYQYKPGGGDSFNCEDITCIITHYCPPAQCDTDLYITQVKEWTLDFQSRIIGASGSTVNVNRVWTEDGNGNPKTSFRQGDAIRYRAEKHNSSSSTVSAYFEWLTNGPRTIASWSGNLDVLSGTTFWYWDQNIPSDAPAGTYTFSVSSNYNGQTSSQSTTFTVTDSSSTCPGQYRAEYYNNRYLSGSPTFIQCEDWPINHDWGGGGPGNGVGNDNFSVRWTGRAYISEGNYTFIARTDDGMRVWLDNNLIIDAWWDQPPTEHRAILHVNSGEHDIKVEYYENGGGAVAQFRWQQALSNLALGKPALASSVQHGDENLYGPQNATDGNLNTRWSSRQQYEGGQNFEWIYVSLEGWYNVNKVILNWETAYATRYNIQIWDGAQWVIVDVNDFGQGGVETRTFPTRNTCCVAVVGVEKVNSSWGYSLWEFEVYESETASVSEISKPSLEVIYEELPEPIRTEGAIYLPIILNN